VHVWRKLLRTLRTLAKDENTMVILAHFARYPDAEAAFWKLLDRHFHRRRVPPAQLSPKADRTSVYVLSRRTERGDSA
jgi:hypothetical protein